MTFTYGQAAADSYELYWDDADRLIAAQIWFAACRPRSGRFGCTLNTSYTSVRWHYHYLGSTLIAATRELNGTDASHNPITLIKRFWASSDERGFVYRLTDEAGATYWQARWDAFGNRTWVGTPQDEMWVPFGRPGQIVLGDTMISSATLNAGTAAYSSGSGGSWTRPSLTLNRIRAYDPLMGAFLQPDPADTRGRLLPEGYAYGRWSPIAMVDVDGADSDQVNPQEFQGPPKKCKPQAGFEEYADSWNRKLQAAIESAARDIAACKNGLCGLGAAGRNLKRAWLYFLSHDDYNCTGFGGEMLGASISLDGRLETETGLAGATDMPGFRPFPQVFLPPAAWMRYFDFYGPGGYVSCPAKVVAHEVLHTALDNMTFDQFANGGLLPANVEGWVPPDRDGPAVWETVRDHDPNRSSHTDYEEDMVVEISECVHC